MTEETKALAGIEKIDFIDVIQYKRAKLLEVALSLVDDWWIEYQQARDSQGEGTKGYLGVRVREYQVAVGIEYFVTVFRKNQAGEISKTFRTIPRGSKLQYTNTTLKRARAKPWEIELAMKWEPRFEQIRKESLGLAKIARSVRDYEKDVQARMKVIAAGRSGSGVENPGCRLV